MGRARNGSRGTAARLQTRAPQGRNVLYLRHGYEEDLQPEMKALRERFVVVDDLEQVQPGDRVLCRFSMLPFPQLLAQEIENKGAVLVHSVDAQAYLADARQWYPHLQGITPKTWFALEDVEGDGPYFVKGVTNSIKSDFNACYAADRQDLGRVLAAIAADPLVSQQPLCIRQFTPLKTYAVNPQTQAPISEEYRCFIAAGKVLSRGYYWSESLLELAERGIVPDADAIPNEFLEDVIERVGEHADYYVVDVARTDDGEWLVVELNDATMSGIAGNDPEVLYSRLLEQLTN